MGGGRSDTLQEAGAELRLARIIIGTSMSEPSLDTYPSRSTEKLRYGDTDRQGHINNAVFLTLLESGRVAIIYDPKDPMAAEGCAFVIARVEVDFRAELNWPGNVEVGTAVTRVGTSSMEISQALFQNGACAATSRSVIVQMNEATRRSHPLTERARARLQEFSVVEP
jgi:acyl-CoA thioester hydrolase